MWLKQNLLFLFLFFSLNFTYSQVYNYIPIHYNDFETNPSVLACELLDRRFQAIHNNSLFRHNAFALSSVKVSKYYEDIFCGLGFSLNNTIVGKQTNYNHAAISGAYRNVLLNKIYVKVGASYKIINTNSFAGAFDYYSFKPSNTKKNAYISNNLNLSLSFASSMERYYMSFAVLNMNLPLTPKGKEIEFPRYYALNAGNLMSLFYRSSANDELSYSGFGKVGASNKLEFSHYVNLKFKFYVNRYSIIQYGIRMGGTQKDFYQFTPMLTYHRDRVLINMSYSFHRDTHTFRTKYFSTTGLNLIYLL